MDKRTLIRPRDAGDVMASKANRGGDGPAGWSVAKTGGNTLTAYRIHWVDGERLYEPVGAVTLTGLGDEPDWLPFHDRAYAALDNPDDPIWQE